MPNIVSLDDYREKRGLHRVRPASPVDDLCANGQNLAATLRTFASAVRSWAGFLEQTGAALSKHGRDLKAERARAERCQADCEAIVRAIESGDIEACERLRDVLAMRESRSST